MKNSMNRTTRSISLVLISSALLLGGCSRSEEKEQAEQNRRPAGIHAGTGGGGNIGEEAVDDQQPADNMDNPDSPQQSGSSSTSHATHYVHGRGYVPIPVLQPSSSSGSRSGSGTSGSSSKGTVTRGGFGSSGQAASS